MLLAKVKGNVVSTHKNKHLIGHKLMVVRAVGLDGSIVGKKDVIAVDLIDAGIGDTVLVVIEGDAVQQILGHRNAPVNAIITAVVDDIDIAE